MSVYYKNDGITLYLGDCREHLEWLAADVLVTDPPYGRNWSIPAGKSHASGGAWSAKPPIVGDESTAVRDEILGIWGSRPAVCFGDLLLEPPAQTRRVLIYQKPPDAGIMGSGAGFRKDVEAIYLSGAGWSPRGTRSAVIATAARGMSGTLTTPTGHPHTKPLDVLQVLIAACPPGIVADPFAGSGSTLVAARLEGREAMGVEVEERYCEVVARRLDQGVLEFPA